MSRHLESADAAQEVVLAYHRAIDTGRASEGIDFFTDDAVLQAKGMNLVGREAIAGFLNERQSQTERHTVHVVANVSIVRAQPDEVELAALVLLHVQQDDGRYDLERVLDTTHVVTRTSAGWRVHRRLSRPLHAPRSDAAGTRSLNAEQKAEGNHDVTTTETAITPSPLDSPVALQMGELVLKSGRFEAMHAWYTHMLGHGPFFERTPDADSPPRPAGVPERAVDVRLAFFLVHENEHPHHQVIGLFGMDSLIGAEASGPGLHHFQFGTGSLESLFVQYERMKAFGVHPHRTANHGQATSFYFRDPDGNVIEFTTSNFPTMEEELAFMASPAFAANPSGLELNAEEFATRYHAGEPRESLLSLEPQAGGA